LQEFFADKRRVDQIAKPADPPTYGQAVGEAETLCVGQVVNGRGAVFDQDWAIV
jgi:hypothetical protein